MKRKVLSAAVAAAVTAGPAYALDPSVAPINYEIVVSGATAPKDTLMAVIRTQICDPATADQFNNGTHDTIFCTVRAPNFGLGVDRNIMFIKNNGGSGTGAGAVQNNLPVTVYIPASYAVCGAPIAAPNGGFFRNSCTGATTTRNPDWGMSDVEPEIFVGALAPPASEGGPFIPGGPILGGVNSGEPPVRLPGLGFGAVVTRNLYQALQHVQFPDTSVCDPVVNAAKAGDGNDDDGSVSGSTAADKISDAYQEEITDSVQPFGPGNARNHRRGDTRACMPNMSREEIAAVLGGDVPTLAELVVSSTGRDIQAENGGPDFNPGTADDFPWTTTDGNLYVCRRRSGSGTHAQTSIFFLRTQCDVSGRVMATSAELPGQLFENVSSGNLDRCMNAVDQGIASGGGANIVPNVPAGPRKYGVGYQSVEKNADFSGSYRFVKVDGRAPTLVEMHAGNYLNFGELTMQKRDPVTYNSNPAVDIAAREAMFAAIATSMSDPAGVELLNDQLLFKHPYGQAGFLIAPDPFGAPARTPDVALNLANPIGNFLHRDTSGGALANNSCLPPRKGLPFFTPIPVDN